jgi:hypothetical protein
LRVVELFESELNRPASRNQLEDQGHYGQYQQNVDETAHRVAAHHSHQPQHKQNYEDCPKHSSLTPKPCWLMYQLEAS